MKKVCTLLSILVLIFVGDRADAQSFREGNVVLTTEFSIREYDRQGNQIQRFAVPDPTQIRNTRDAGGVAVGLDGRVHVFQRNRNFTPYYSSYDPVDRSWIHRRAVAMSNVTTLRALSLFRDKGYSRYEEFSLDGTSVRLIDFEFNRPSAVHAGRDGFLYSILRLNDESIFKFSTEFAEPVSPLEEFPLVHPDGRGFASTAIAVAENGDIFVYGGGLVRFDSSGTYLDEISIPFIGTIHNIAIADDGTIAIGGDGHFALVNRNFETVDVIDNLPQDEIYVSFVPQQLAEVSISEGGVQRSMLTEIEVCFLNKVVIGEDAFTMVMRGTNESVELAASVDDSGLQTKVTLTFSGPLTEPSGSLVDGNFQLTINGDQITDASSGKALDLDRDGIHGGSLVFGDEESEKCYRLFGDVNESRSVDILDLLGFRQTYLLMTGDASFAESFDSNLDGIINVSDLLKFRVNYLKEIPFDTSKRSRKLKPNRG